MTPEDTAPSSDSPLVSSSQRHSVFFKAAKEKGVPVGGLFLRVSWGEVKALLFTREEEKSYRQPLVTQCTEPLNVQLKVLPPTMPTL